MTRMTVTNIVAVFALVLLPSAMAQASEGEIEFTYVPPFGSHDNLEGLVFGADPDDYRVAAYIYVSGWWTKPYWNQPLTSINIDGSWTCDITTDGTDENATQIIAFLVPNGYDPPLGSGEQCLPSELYDYPYAEAIRYEKLDFAGYEWRIKRSGDPVEPGPNYFEDNAWVDGAGNLHLQIDQRDGDWYCSEVIADESFGYGTYVFTVCGRIDLLDENIVLGLFTWEDCVPEHNYREIDIELSQWGNSSNDNAQFVVQPWDMSGNMFRFNIDLPRCGHKKTTHVFSWQPECIRFWSYYGDASSVIETENLIASWHYSGDDIPPAGNENPRINFWLMGGSTPNNGSEAEIVLTSFQHVSDCTVEAAVKIQPQTLNLAKKGQSITCCLKLGDWCDVAEIDPASIRLEDEIEPDVFRAREKKQLVIARFNFAKIRKMLRGRCQKGCIDLTVSGALNDGTRFVGTDRIKIAAPRKPVKKKR